MTQDHRWRGCPAPAGHCRLRIGELVSRERREPQPRWRPRPGGGGLDKCVPRRDAPGLLSFASQWDFVPPSPRGPSVGAGGYLSLRVGSGRCTLPVGFWGSVEAAGLLFVRQMCWRPQAHRQMGRLQRGEELEEGA